ncbi:MAG TPA: SH3 domain-containing protein [Candidatus Ozemobacteraceae bacterium]|nr:SH3 domain-containing protein [Candidatus Ozemobacteraceae bacterium]
MKPHRPFPGWCALGVACAFGLCLQPSLAEPEPIASKTGRITAPKGLIIRDAPGRDGNKLATLPVGETVEILSLNGPEETIETVKNHWFHVKRGTVDGWAFGGFIETRDSPPPETATAKVSREECLGKDPESIGKRMNLSIKESRTVDPDARYGIDCYGTDNQITTVFFGKVVDHKADGSEILKILDVLFLPAITENQFFSHCANLDEKRDDELMGIGLDDKQEGFFKKSVKVWRANVKKEKFEDAPTDGVLLSVPNDEDQF